MDSHSQTPIRAKDLRVGGLYRWHLGDPKEFFLILKLPDHLESININKVLVLSSKHSYCKMGIFYSDKFLEIS